MNIRFINMTTTLPVDEKIEQEFKKTIDHAYRKAVEHRYADRLLDRYIDVFFVSEDDVDLSKNKEEGDWLGVYIGFHSEFNRSIIKVCPERVMESALAFKLTGGGTLPLIRRYPVLLVAVVIHELAHWLMDGDNEPDVDVYPWAWLIECRLEEDPNYHYSGRHRPPHHSRNISQPQKSLRHFIEESLAEAFILKQQVTGAELDYLRAFTVASPPGYSSGVFWSGSHAKMQQTALSWARFKEHYLQRPKWDFVFAASNTPLDTLIARLKRGVSVDFFDFEREFIDHLASQVARWQVSYQADKSNWGDRLNGTFGVYWHLAHSTYLRASVRLKFLKQWAANGSLEAIDKLHETRARNAESRGNFKNALEHLKARLLHLPMMEHNDYWHKRHLDEINAAISALQSRMATQS